MAVTDFDTKVAVVVRDDLATWQPLNVTAFLMSGIVGDAGGAVRSVSTNDLDLFGVGLRAPHRDADAVLRGVKRHP